MKHRFGLIAGMASLFMVAGIATAEEAAAPAADAKPKKEEVKKAAPEEAKCTQVPGSHIEEEPFDEGTLAIANAVAEATDHGAISIVGGGDSVAAVNQAGLDDQISHISTGGGATLEFLAGDTLPGVAALDDK